MFSKSSNFQVTFVRGFTPRQLRSKTGLLSTLQSLRILENATPEKLDECWKSMKHLSRDRSVLACTLAHLKAMSMFVEEGADYDFICEDNIRGPVTNGQSYDRILKFNSQAPDADLLYYAYGGRANEILQWQQELDRCSKEWDSWPTTTDFEGSASSEAGREVGQEAGHEAGHEAGRSVRWCSEMSSSSGEKKKEPKQSSVLWGLMAYKPSPAVYHAVLEEIQADMPGSLAWQPKRGQSQIAKPADKLIPKYSLKRKLNVVVTKNPAFFRAPISSTIHPKLDGQFMDTTMLQLEQSGLTWDDIDLSMEEMATITRHVEEKNKNVEVAVRSSSEGCIDVPIQEKTEEVRSKREWTGKQQERKPRAVHNKPPVEVVCEQCKKHFKSRNRLFAHFQDSESSCICEE